MQNRRNGLQSAAEHRSLREIRGSYSQEAERWGSRQDALRTSGQAGATNMAREKKRHVGRRDFLKGVAAGAGALAATVDPLAAKAAAAAPMPRPMALPPAVEGDPPPATGAEVLTVDRTGSDFMVDCIKALGIEYVCAVAGSSFRALHESVINYGGNKNPEFITCCHEEVSVAMGHGYAKIEGKPLCMFAHGT